MQHGNRDDPGTRGNGDGAMSTEDMIRCVIIGWVAGVWIVIFTVIGLIIFT